MRKIFHKLVSLDEALAILESRVKLEPLGIEEVELSKALGRVLAEDIYAPIDYPPFDRSEVDGYAVRAEDTYGADDLHPVKLCVRGAVSVGEVPRVEVKEGEAVEVATGAMIPRGANAVIMEEYVVRHGDEIEIYRAVSPRENIAIAGSDIPRGELVLTKGTVLSPYEIALLAALGIEKVKVFRKPRIAVVSTGSELLKPGTRLELGKIYDVNGYAVTSYLRNMGIEADYIGILPDDIETIKKAIKELVKEYDIVITSGGTSAGISDVIYRAIEELGEILIHGLKVKPGKPTVIGVVEGKLVIGLPGFPYSAMTIVLMVLKRILAKVCGIEELEDTYVEAELASSLRKGIGRVWLVPVIINEVRGRRIAIPLIVSSGSISHLVEIEGIAILSEDREVFNEGEIVRVTVLKPLERRKLTIMGSHDIALRYILRDAGILKHCKIISVGSYAGLELVSKGYVDIAPIHLLDRDSGVYNKPFIEKLGIKDKVMLVRGYRRRLVLAYARGNPKNIKGFEDLLREDVMFVNRNKGSGTRVYIDLTLERLAERVGMEFDDLVRKIRGYTYEVNTHTAVAAAIAQGRADVGVCIEYAAKLYDLDYIPLTWEEYDFVISRESIDKEETQQFIEYLKSAKAKKLISSLPGYEAPEDMGLMII